MLAVIDVWLGRLLALGAALSALLMIFCAGSLGYGILVRLTTGASSIWPIDMAGHTLVYIVMLAAAEAFRRNEHIGVDLLTARLPPRGRAIADRWAALVVLVTAAVLLWTGIDMVQFSRAINLHTSDYVELPLHIVQAAMPVGAFMLALAAARRLFGPPPAQEEEP
ncbi:TRAP transporter small permease [Aquibium sp. LZ166]|uniref:TRAP transporter small permease protein n=1 Tax=Aquibium pacificus TaxID=3153579 RepID=A0ABV3SRU6_9HYPH